LGFLKPMITYQEGRRRRFTANNQWSEGDGWLLARWGWFGSPLGNQHEPQTFPTSRLPHEDVRRQNFSGAQVWVRFHRRWECVPLRHPHRCHLEQPQAPGLLQQDWEERLTLLLSSSPGAIPPPLGLGLPDLLPTACFQDSQPVFGMRHTPHQLAGLPRPLRLPTPVASNP
jgi:hypothetical protein